MAELNLNQPNVSSIGLGHYDILQGSYKFDALTNDFLAMVIEVHPADMPGIPPLAHDSQVHLFIPDAI